MTFRILVPNQGLNPGHGSESATSQPLDHQGIPANTFCLFDYSYPNGIKLAVIKDSKY